MTKGERFIVKDEGYAYSRAHRKSEGANKSERINKPDGTYKSDETFESDGTNKTERLNHTKGSNKTEGANRTEGTNKTKGLNQTEGTNKTKGLNQTEGTSKTGGSNKTKGLSQTEGSNRTERANKTVSRAASSKKAKERAVSILLLFLGLLFMTPLIVTFTNSFFTESEIALNYSSSLSVFDLVDGVVERFMQIKLIPEHVSFGQYSEVLLNQPSFLVLLTNSMKIALPVTIGSLAISMLTAYGFTIWKFRYKEAVFAVYIVVMLMPLQAVLVPNYIVADMLHIKDNYLAIILPGIFSPFGVFLMRQSMKAIPQAYFEAARIDGADNWYIFVHIVIPQMKSSIAALCMLVFIEYWNLVEQAVIFISDYTKEPLSVYLSRIAEGRVGLIFAASCVYMFLPLWLLMLGQKDLEKGIELSGVK